MHTILEMDEHNYDEALPEIRRTAVRGVIFRAGKLLMIRSSFGEVKFPGGGQEQDENDVDTLLREVREETGYHVLPESIRPFGQVVERRLSTYEPMIWHQINRYYFCSIGKEQDACQYSENEQKYGMHQVWVSLAEALETNREMLGREGRRPWNQREFHVLELLAAQMNGKETL
ncbi:MAG: NUDIX domain-containing protein [Clostridiales bacterium]|nr:NUDIX domain-containing protein [Clostridiales bacterium]